MAVVDDGRREVRQSIWLDVPPYGGLSRAVAASAMAAASGVGSSVLGRVTATPVEEPGLPAGWVRAEIPADAPTSEVTGRTDGGVYAVGAIVLVELDSSGRVVMIHAPLDLPEGAVPVAMGVASRWLLEHESLIAETERVVAEAEERLAENAGIVAENEKMVAAATADAARAVEEVKAAVAAGEAAQARADEIAAQAEVDRARLGEVATQAARVSDAEAKAQDAWDKAAGIMASAVSLTAGTWTGSWPEEAHTTKTATEITYDGVLDISGSYSNEGRMYCNERATERFLVEDGRVMRMTAIVSNTHASRDTMVQMAAYRYKPAGVWAGSAAITEHRVLHGADHVRLEATWTVRHAGGSVLVVPALTCKGGPLTVHSVAWEDVTEAAAALAVAQAAQDAASTATQAATRAQATADSRNQITRSTATPTGRGSAVGDVWWRYGSSSLSGAIIGQWTWDGTKWQPSTIGSEIVASLTADKIKGATAELDNAFVNNILSNKGFIDKLYSTRIVVGGSSIFPDPGFVYEDKWATANTSVVANVNFENRKALRINGTGSQSGVYFKTSDLSMARVEPGATYHVSAKVYRYYGSVDSTVTVYLSGANEAGQTWTANCGPLKPSRLSSYQTLEGDIKVPSNAKGEVLVGLFTHYPHMASGQYALVGNVRVVRKTSAVLLEDGAVTAEKITASKELSAKFGNYLEVRTDQLKAGSAAIASDLIASTLRGKEIIGSTIRSGTSYSQRLEASTIVSPSIQAGTISAPTINGGNINGSVFKGGSMIFSPGSNQTLVNATRLIQYRNGAELGRVDWKNLVAPPWGHFQWNSADANIFGPVGKAENGTPWASLAFGQHYGNGVSVSQKWVHVPVTGWYNVYASTCWQYSESKASTYVATGVARNKYHAGYQTTRNDGYVDWYGDPAASAWLIPYGITQPTAGGLIHLEAGEGISLCYWWYDESWSNWNPNTRSSTLAFRLVQAD